MATTRLVYLDSLRGLAALSVVFGHYWGSYSSPEFIKAIDSTPLSFFYNGSGAVSLFFVLSGYVISKNYFKNPEKLEQINFIDYFIKRCFRILPLFIFCLLISFILVNNLHTPNLQTIPLEI